MGDISQASLPVLLGQQSPLRLSFKQKKIQISKQVQILVRIEKKSDFSQAEAIMAVMQAEKNQMSCRQKKNQMSCRQKKKSDVMQAGKNQMSCRQKKIRCHAGRKKSDVMQAGKKKKSCWQ